MTVEEFLEKVNAERVAGRWRVVISPSNRVHVANSSDDGPRLTSEGRAMMESFKAPRQSPPARKTRRKRKAEVEAEAEIDVPRGISNIVVEDAEVIDNLNEEPVDDIPDFET